MDDRLLLDRPAALPDSDRWSAEVLTEFLSDEPVEPSDDAEHSISVAEERAYIEQHYDEVVRQIAAPAPCPRNGAPVRRGRERRLATNTRRRGSRRGASRGDPGGDDPPDDHEDVDRYLAGV